MSPQPANSSPGTSAPRAACCCLPTDGALQGSTTGMAATACQTRSRDCHTTTRILACHAGHLRPSFKQLGSSKGTSCALSLLLSRFLLSSASAVALSWLGLGFLPLCSLHTANWSRRTWHRRPLHHHPMDMAPPPTTTTTTTTRTASMLPMGPGHGSPGGMRNRRGCKRPAISPSSARKALRNAPFRQ
jgi:hypothetical protein